MIMCSYGSGIIGVQRAKRTLAKSFASWPPWLMMGYQCRVAGSKVGRLLTACACRGTPQTRYRS